MCLRATYIIDQSFANIKCIKQNKIYVYTTHYSGHGHNKKIMYFYLTC